MSMMNKIKLIMKPDGLYYGNKYIADFSVEVIKRIRYETITGDLLRKEYILKAVFPDGSYTSEITVSNIENVKYSDYWDRCIEKKCSSEQKKYLVIHMQEQMVNMQWEIRIELDHTGWYQQGVYVFDKNKVISSDSGVTYIPKGELPVYGIGKVAEEKTMIDYINRWCHFYPTVTDVLFAYRCLSILKPLFCVEKGIKLDMVCDLIGRSGSFKTTLSEIMLSDTKAEIKLISAKFRDIEKSLYHYQGGFVILDDYKKVNQDHARKKMLDILDLLTRVADHQNTAMVAITSEFLTGDFSFQDRLIQINVEKVRNEYTDEQIRELTFFQENKYIIDYFWYDFAKCIYMNVERVNSFIEKQVALLNRKTQFRIERNIHLLEIAYEIYSELYDVKNAYAYYDITQSLRSLEERQKNHMMIVNILEYEQDWVMLFYLAFNNGYLDINNDSFMYDKHGHVCIQRRVLENGMTKFLQTPCCIDKMLDDFEEKGILFQDSSKDRTLKRNGRRYYVIDFNKILNYKKNMAEIYNKAV